MKNPVEFRGLYESDITTVLFKGLSSVNQKILAEYGRLISIRSNTDPERYQFYLDVFIICRTLLMMDSGEFDLDEIIDKYSRFRSKDSQIELKKETGKTEVFFEEQVIVAFLKYRQEHG